MNLTRFIPAQCCFLIVGLALAFTFIPAPSNAEQKRGVELTEQYFYDLSDVERKFIQLTLKGYGLYDGPIDGLLGPGTYRGMEKLADLLGRERWQSDFGYSIGHPQGIWLFLDDLFSGRAFAVFPFPSTLESP